MGLDINKAINQVNKVAEKNGRINQKVNIPHAAKMDYITSGITVVNSLTNLTTTILNAKEETKRLQIDSDLQQAALDSDLKKMRIELTESTGKMKLQLEEARLKQQERLKEIDADMHNVVQIEQTKREVIKVDHEERMVVLGMQRDILNTIMAIYQKYYDGLFSGNSILVFPEDIGQQMQNCIETIHAALKPVSLGEQTSYLNGD